MQNTIFNNTNSTQFKYVFNNTTLNNNNQMRFINSNLVPFISLSDDSFTLNLFPIITTARHLSFLSPYTNILDTRIWQRYHFSLMTTCQTHESERGWDCV